jgi:NrS-1  polymerase HBD domain
MTSGEIRERSSEIAALHATVFGPRTRSARPAPVNNGHVSSQDDRALLERARQAKNGEKFAALWNGRFEGDYPSQSEADLALCGLLAFWCQRDPAQMDRLFRRSGLYREKWNEPRGAQTYGELTIAKAIAECTEVSTPRPGKAKKVARHLDPDDPAMDLEGDIQDAQATQDQEPRGDPPAAYVFQSAFAPDHFVSQYIELVSVRTDAAHEYAEAGALLLLAMATPGVRARLNIFPGGLGTNLYLLVLGRSTRSRKSTVLRATTDLIERSHLALNLLPDKMSPEAFIEQMAAREGRGAL